LITSNYKSPIETVPSIGSELAASDQFEIVVSSRRDTDRPGSSEQRRGKIKNGFFAFFTSDQDDSTVSSITTVEYGGGFFHGKRTYSIHKVTHAAAASISSWCCCGDESDPTSTKKNHHHGTTNSSSVAATRQTLPSSTTDNTLIQHSMYGSGMTIQPTDSRSQMMMYRSMSGSVSPIKRQRSFVLFPQWGRNSNNNKGDGNKYMIHTNNSMKNTTPNMSASLFDDLSEDELDLLVKRSNSFSVGRRGKKSMSDPSLPSPLLNQQQQQQVSLRRVMTWKRKVF
jgi:hypothetical protein